MNREVWRSCFQLFHQGELLKFARGLYFSILILLHITLIHIIYLLRIYIHIYIHTLSLYACTHTCFFIDHYTYPHIILGDYVREIHRFLTSRHLLVAAQCLWRAGHQHGRCSVAHCAGGTGLVAAQRVAEFDLNLWG